MLNIELWNLIDCRGKKYWRAKVWHSRCSRACGSGEKSTICPQSIQLANFWCCVLESRRPQSEIGKKRSALFSRAERASGAEIFFYYARGGRKHIQRTAYDVDIQLRRRERKSGHGKFMLRKWNTREREARSPQICLQRGCTRRPDICI